MQKIFSRIHAFPQLSLLGSPGMDPLNSLHFLWANKGSGCTSRKDTPSCCPPIWVTDRARRDPSS